MKNMQSEIKFCKNILFAQSMVMIIMEFNRCGYWFIYSLWVIIESTESIGWIKWIALLHSIMQRIFTWLHSHILYIHWILFLRLFKHYYWTIYSQSTEKSYAWLCSFCGRTQYKQWLYSDQLISLYLILLWVEWLMLIKSNFWGNYEEKW